VSKNLLGVIGGLGPMATAHFMKLAVTMTEAQRDQDNIDMMVYNFPSIPDRTGYILGSNLRSPLPGLLNAGRNLHRQGASLIAVPCVTAHYFYEDLTAAIPTPIIHCIRETAAALKAQGVESAGIMATEGTVRPELISRELEQVGIRAVLPSASRQADVNHLIYRNIKAGKPAEMDRFYAVSQELKDRNAQVIILGCTELSVLKERYILGSGFLDALEVLAQRSVTLCGGRLKPEFRNLIT
jgi:aspartate racemase